MKFLIAFLLVLISGCNSHNAIVKHQNEPNLSKYTSHQEVGELLKNQSQGYSYKTIYIVFSADWCDICNRLYAAIQETNFKNKVIFVDVDKTWAFLFSRELGIEGIPSMAIIKSNKTIQTRTGIKEIISYLKNRLSKEKKVKIFN